MIFSFTNLLMFLIGLNALRTTRGTNYGNNAESFRCYDCDYDQQDEDVQGRGPSQGQDPGLGQYGNSYNPSIGNGASQQGKAATDAGQSTRQGVVRGFSRCALDPSTNDHRYVRETNCQLGVCFIRKDFNGLIYRGCADPSILPLDINTGVQCQSQGLRPAIWWFCNGTLCNSGRFSGTLGVCSNQPATEASGAPANQNTASRYVSGASNNHLTTIVDVASAVPSGSPSYGMTFEQVQERLGYGGQSPIFYGGTGVSSVQASQLYSATSSGHVQNNDVPRKSSSKLSPQKMIALLGDATKSVYQVPQRAAPGQSAMAGKGVKYQSQNQQQQQQQQQQKQQTGTPPALPYNDLNNGVMTATGTGVTLAQNVPPQAVPYNDNRQPDVAVVGSPSGGEHTSSSGSGGAAYKTWDFVVLAQSRLHRLAQIAQNNYVESRNSAAMSDIPQSQVVVQPYVEPHSTASSSGGNYDTGATMVNVPVPNQVVNKPYSKSLDTAATAASQPAAGAGGASQSQYGGRSSDVIGQESVLSRFSSCDGRCHDNPSGLFADPSRRNAFIQCGPGMDYETGMACQCCRPQRMLCPDNTSFDNVTKVCSRANVGVKSATGNQPMSQSKY